jgi:hypothetical protein
MLTHADAVSASGGWGRRPLYIDLTIWIILDRGICSL